MTYHPLSKIHTGGNPNLDTLTGTRDFALSETFPVRTWATLCSQDLLGNFLKWASEPDPKEKLLCRDIATTSYALACQSRNLSLPMTYVGQGLKLYFLDALGDHSVHANSARDIRQGNALCALAISEPGVGAHPKHLRCTARVEGEEYVLNGQKTWVTHGPYADWFIVLAITAESGIAAKHPSVSIASPSPRKTGQKAFSAFLLPRDTRGLEINTLDDQGALRPISHAHLDLTQCRVPKHNLLGKPGTAFNDISRPMRIFEDVLMQSAIAGALQGELDQFSPPQTKSESERLGHLLCLTEAASKLSIMAAESLDHSEHPVDPTALVVGFRALAREIIAGLGKLPSKNLDESTHREVLLKDIDVLMNIGASATSLKVAKLAEAHYPPSC